LRLGTLLFRLILKYRRNILWVKTESLFFKYVSTAKARCSTDQRSMDTEMLWVSLEERSRTNSPRQRFHSQLFCKIARCFCRTLYLSIIPLMLPAWWHKDWSPDVVQVIGSFSRSLLRRSKLWIHRLHVGQTIVMCEACLLWKTTDSVSRSAKFLISTCASDEEDST
jgi:hypothetical protein